MRRIDVEIIVEKHLNCNQLNCAHEFVAHGLATGNEQIVNLIVDTINHKTSATNRSFRFSSTRLPSHGMPCLPQTIDFIFCSLVVLLSVQSEPYGRVNVIHEQHTDSEWRRAAAAHGLVNETTNRVPNGLTFYAFYQQIDTIYISPIHSDCIFAHHENLAQHTSQYLH